MTAASPSLRHELNDLVREQIHAFKQHTGLTDTQIFEYHLRHVQIMTLYQELDRKARGGIDSLRG